MLSLSDMPSGTRTTQCAHPEPVPTSSNSALSSHATQSPASDSGSGSDADTSSGDSDSDSDSDVDSDTGTSKKRTNVGRKTQQGFASQGRIKRLAQIKGRRLRLVTKTSFVGMRARYITVNAFAEEHDNMVICIMSYREAYQLLAQRGLDLQGVPQAPDFDVCILVCHLTLTAPFYSLCTHERLCLAFRARCSNARRSA